MLRSLIIVVICAAISLTGCAQAAQKAVEQATGVQTSQQGDTVTIKGKDGESVTIQGKDGDTVTIQGKDGESVTISSQLPQELKDFPVPEGFKLDSGGSMASGAEKVLVATWSGTGTHQSVTAFYQKTLPGKGWQEESSFTSKDGSLLTYRRGDQDGVTITTSQEGDKLTISVMMGQGTRMPGAAPGSAKSQSGGGTSGSSGEAKTGPARTSFSSELPAELKDLPVPGGFAVAEDGAMRAAEGDTFTMATANLKGKLSVKEVGDFYKKELTAKGWTQTQFIEADDDAMGMFANEKEKLDLVVQITKTDDGTEVNLMLTKK